MLGAEELEILVSRWATCQEHKYSSVMRPAGAGDRGCDVIGFYSSEKFEGEWDNYQCKQYKNTLPTASGMHELGKMLYYAFLGEFTAPKNYYFVAPKGVNRNLRTWILNPSQLKKELLNQWGKFCEETIIDGRKVLLSTELYQFISNYNFSNISIIDIDYMVNDSYFRAILVDLYGGELPRAPAGEVPNSIHESELNYVNKVLDVYSEYDQQVYSNPEDIIGHDEFEEDFMDQRERFYSAEAFRTFYRDNTVEGTLDTFEKEILKGIRPTLRLKYKDSFECMCTVLSEAGKLQPSGKLAIHGKIDVKQGYCHHFANEDRLNWRRK
ncbi:ABC-three component system protein [Vibrio sp. 10N.222.55.B11]|uniref:ABC-three component system protein n=1 Tax=Vibrio sp. 10N.222.55.B11 TaxID=3229648 RepID=UPI00355311D1